MIRFFFIGLHLQLIQIASPRQAQAVVVRGHAHLGEKCAVEGARIVIAAQKGNLCDGKLRVAQKIGCFVDTQGVDILPEVDVQLLGEDMA